mgnify:CR=1 FL=1
MLSVCVSELDTFTTPARCGDMHAIQSLRKLAIAINDDAFACDSKIVAPPLGPCRIKLIVYSAGFLRILYELITSPLPTRYPSVPE